MISLRRCQKLVDNDSQRDDEELELLRQQMSELVALVIDLFETEKLETKPAVSEDHSNISNGLEEVN